MIALADIPIIMQVHDELVVEVPEPQADTIAAQLKQGMEGAAALKVPLTVDVAVGKNWAEC